MSDLVCPSCSCLCDDIHLHFQGEELSRVKNACLKGSAFFRAAWERKERPCRVEGRSASLEEAVTAAAGLLKGARNPLIYGLDNSTIEAQQVALRLSRRLGAVMDDTSSFCQGALTQGIITGKVPTCTLAEAAQLADMIVYWGANPYHAHPRHLSKYTYYPRSQYREAGWTPDVVLAGVDVRETETSITCHKMFWLPPGGDREFIGQVMSALAGKEASLQAASFATLIEEAHFTVFFVGLGLVYSLGNDLDPFMGLLAEARSRGKAAAVPMVGHFNTMGFNYTLYAETGYVNRVSFANGGGPQHGPEFSILEQLRRGAVDCLLVVGADPFTSLPHSLVSNLDSVPIICLDPFSTPTFEGAQVAIPVAPSAVEVPGTARRMDGEVVTLPHALPARGPGDGEVLGRLLEAMG
jgi:formylmethanofuran dehydrogenase subunit B